MAIDPDGWTPAIPFGELPEGTTVRVQAFGTAVLVLRHGESVFAVSNRCTHQGAPLDRGVAKLDSPPTITCPAHGSVFSLDDGRVRRGPATQPLQAFDVRVNEGSVELRLRT